MTVNGVEVVTGFDGSSPRSIEHVRFEDSRIVFFPCVGKSRDSKIRNRFFTRLVNHNRDSVRQTVIVDWTPEGIDNHPAKLNHDYGYIRHQACLEEWMFIAGIRRGHRVEFALNLPPGETEFAYQPEYNYERMLAWVRSLQETSATVKVCGKSREHRDILSIELSAVDPEAPVLMIQARDHPYETAGSFCCEGIVAFLLSNDPMAGYLRMKFHFLLLPMTNPDGVYNGLGRFATEDGVDLNRVNTLADPAHSTVRRLIDATRPIAHLSLHNWTQRFCDGLLCNNEDFKKRMTSLFPSDHEHFKSWSVSVEERCGDGMYWKDYVASQFGAVGAVLEFPWFGLNALAMKKKGAKALTAFCLAVIEDKGL